MAQINQQSDWQSPQFKTLSRKSTLPYDARFRRLLSAEDWAGLPKAVQARFSKRIMADATATYRGTIREIRFSRMGWVLAQVCRLIGGPLPLHRDKSLAAVVTVSEDIASGGQCWTRAYSHAHGFPQVIHSAKRFAGPTGLEEYLGCGIGMALKVRAVPDGLEFASDHYFVRFGKWQMRIPKWLEPGRTIVRHQDLGQSAFSFSLALNHPVLGELVYQEGKFQDG